MLVRLGKIKELKINKRVRPSWMGKGLPDLFLVQSQGTEWTFLHRMSVLANAATALLVAARGSQYWTPFSLLKVNLQKY